MEAVGLILIIIFIAVIQAIINKKLKKNKRKKINSKRNIEREKKKTKINYIENKQKGDEFEKFVGKYYEDLGYTVAYHGIDNGRKDHGIDIIAKKEKEIIFIQCKNWKKEGRKINLDKVKSFVGDTYTYIDKNPMFKDYEIKRILAITNPILNKQAYNYIKYNQNLIKYKIFKFES